MLKRGFIVKGFIIALLSVLVISGCSTGGSSTAPSGNTGTSGSDSAANGAAETEQPSEWKGDLVLGAGALGGVYYTMGGAIADLLQQKVEGIDRVSVLTGTTSKFIPEVQQGKVDIMFGTPDSFYFGWSEEEGQGFREGERFDKLRMVAVTYINVMDLAVMANSDIQTVKDIGDRKVGIVAATLKVPMEEYLKTHGVENPNVVIIGDWNQLGQALRDGSIAAFQAIAAHPMPAMMDLSNSVDLRLLEYDSEEALETFLSGKETRFFQKVIQPAGTYEWQTEDYHTVGRGTTVGVTADLPEDQVYEITKTIYESVDELAKIHPLMQDFSLDMMQEYLDAGVIQIPFHPGAARYLEEQGIVIPDSVPKE